MKILALETSAKSVSCAVVEDGAPLASAYQCTGLTHSRTLLPMVDAMLKNADLTIGDMDALAIAAGPGSFTGLRIGIAAVKGLAWAADKPCLGVSTLEAMAARFAIAISPSTASSARSRPRRFSIKMPWVSALRPSAPMRAARR